MIPTIDLTEDGNIEEEGVIQAAEETRGFAEYSNLSGLFAE
jgi:hypothetical protein